ncbi:MAG: hypothetical protein K0Q73_4619 [Paenibacillus sp.]|nr:hypothetical protein [Paenibacillus sp.]
MLTTNTLGVVKYVIVLQKICKAAQKATQLISHGVVPYTCSSTKWLNPFTLVSTLFEFDLNKHKLKIVNQLECDSLELQPFSEFWSINLEAALKTKACSSYRW